MTRTTFYTCKNCDHEFELEVEATPPTPARTYGPPENCEPAFEGEFCIISGGACPKCETEVDEANAEDEFWENIADNGWNDEFRL